MAEKVEENTRKRDPGSGGERKKRRLKKVVRFGASLIAHTFFSYKVRLRRPMDEFRCRERRRIARFLCLSDASTRFLYSCVRRCDQVRHTLIEMLLPPCPRLPLNPAYLKSRRPRHRHPAWHRTALSARPIHSSSLANIYFLFHFSSTSFFRFTWYMKNLQGAKNMRIHETNR